MMKRFKALVLTTVLMLSLCGCSFSPFATSEEDLYQLPKLPKEYESLEEQLDKLLSGGAERVSPTSGSNLQSVQMVDLNGDGAEEAVVFLRRSGDEKPMKIYVFREEEKNYLLAYTIEGTSTSIYSIAYVDLDGDGWKELLTGLRSSLDVQTLSVVSLSGGEPRSVLTTGYSRYLYSDLSGDGKQELIVIRGDEENVAFADLYGWSGKELLLTSSLRLSLPVTEVDRLRGGMLKDGENAMFLTGTAEEDTVTEIMTIQDGKLIRTTVLVAPESELYPTDINADGIIEVPEPRPFPKNDPEEETYYQTLWHQYDCSGGDEIVERVFYDYADGWSLVLPASWADGVGVSRSVFANSNTVTFYECSGSPENQNALLTIGCFNGGNKNYPLMHRDWLQLTQQVDTVYAAKRYDPSLKQMNEETLRDSFRLIAADWTTGES